MKSDLSSDTRTCAFHGAVTLLTQNADGRELTCDGLRRVQRIPEDSQLRLLARRRHPTYSSTTPQLTASRFLLEPRCESIVISSFAARRLATLESYRTRIGRKTTLCW